MDSPPARPLPHPNQPLARSSLPDRDTISHIIKFICHSPAYTIPPPCRRVSRCERGVLLLGCVLCVGGGGREGGCRSDGPRPPAPCACGAPGQEWGGQSSDRDGVPDGWRPRLYTHRIFSCSVHMTNPNVAQTRPHKPLNLNRHAHPNRSITMDNAFAGGSTIAHHGIETLRV